MALRKGTVELEMHTERGDIQFRRLDLASIGPDKIDVDLLQAIGLTRYQPSLKPVIGRLISGGAGERDGLREGDEILEIDGRPAGYALYRIKLQFEGALTASRVVVLEAIGESPEATREIWRYLLAIDWVAEIECELLPADHPLFLLVQRPNRLSWKVVDGLWLRLIDVGAALSVRAAASDGRVTFDVCADPVLPDNVGTWTVEDGVARRSRRRADLRLDVQTLGSAYLGGFTFAELARAGRVEEVARGGVARADALYRVDAKPWCPEIF